VSVVLGVGAHYHLYVPPYSCLAPVVLHCKRKQDVFISCTNLL
jgi:hypothetical protein